MPDKPVLIVTGGGRGIGAATAKLAASRGYAVCVHYLASHESAGWVADAIRATGGYACAVQADIRIESEVVRFSSAPRRSWARFADW